jgi:hypothetical protein
MVTLASRGDAGNWHFTKGTKSGHIRRGLSGAALIAFGDDLTRSHLKNYRVPMSASRVRPSILTYSRVCSGGRAPPFLELGPLATFLRWLLVEGDINLDDGSWHGGDIQQSSFAALPMTVLGHARLPMQSFTVR